MRAPTPTVDGLRVPWILVMAAVRLRNACRTLDGLEAMFAPKNHPLSLANVALLLLLGGGCGGEAAIGQGPTSGVSPPPVDMGVHADLPVMSDVGEDMPTVCEVLDADVSSRGRRCELLIHRGSSWNSFGVDIDGDGREEVLGNQVSDPLTDTPSRAQLIRWDGSAFERMDLGIDFSGRLVDCGLWYDMDGDGLPDLSCVRAGLPYPIVFSNPGTGTLGPLISTTEFDENIEGTPVLVDPTLDGFPERLAMAKEPPELYGFGLYRDTNEGMQAYGPRYQLEGCSIPDSSVRADFDEDGLDDVGIFHQPQRCDGYPLSYDPAWHSLHVLLTRPETETMELVAPVPIGAVSADLPQNALYAGEMTGDEHIDFAVLLKTPGVLSVIPGNGDGTFGEPVVYTADELGLPTDGNNWGEGVSMRFFGQFDEDPYPEVVGWAAPDRLWVLDDHLSGLATVEALNVSARPQGAADLDGDGVDDLVLSGLEIPGLPMGLQDSFVLFSKL